MKNADNSLQNQVIKMSNTLAEKSTHFSVVQQKLFYISLAALKNGTNSDNEVIIDKKDLFDYLGLAQDTSRWTTLRYQLKKLRYNSEIEFSDGDHFDDGQLITGARSCQDGVHIRFDPYYLPLIQELANNYVRLLDDDVVSFCSKYSMMLYQNLLKDKWKLTNVDYLGIDYSTRQLKMMFGLSKDDYVKKDGHFNRTTFENRTIDIAVKDINEKSKCIQNLRYEKVKKGNRVQYYLFTFNYTDPQKVVEDARNERRWEQLSLLDDIPTVEKPVRVSDEVKELNWWE